MIQTLGVVAAIAMPFFNIPLVIRIIQRKSSADISLVWATGIWVCVLGMLPSSLQSTDQVFKSFGLINTGMFSIAYAIICWYHPIFRKTQKEKI